MEIWGFISPDMGVKQGKYAPKNERAEFFCMKISPPRAETFSGNSEHPRALPEKVSARENDFFIRKKLR